MGCSCGCFFGTLTVIGRGQRRECILKESRCVNLNVLGVVLVIVMLVSFVCCWPGAQVGQLWRMVAIGCCRLLVNGQRQVVAVLVSRTSRCMLSRCIKLVGGGGLRWCCKHCNHCRIGSLCCYLDLGAKRCMDIVVW